MTEKSLKDLGDKVSQSERLTIEQCARDLKDALKSDDVSKIKRAMDALMQASHKLAEEVYKCKAQSAGGSQDTGHKSQEESAGTSSSGKGDDNVVDAEFKVEDDKK